MAKEVRLMKQEKQLRSLAKQYRIDRGKKFNLRDFDPGDTAGLPKEFKEESKELLQRSTELLADLQDKLFAQDRWGLLLIFQAMDAAGKDGTIKHVMSGVNPQGCEVYSFKSPSTEELEHGYLWRTSKRMPPRGKIGIFNRSYYEEVLVVRVHPELLEAERLPTACMSNDIWKERFEDISAFERYATRNGIAIRKFFLHVSKEEQKRRFLSRLDLPEKNWKFSAADVRERGYWDEYQNVYEEMIQETASKRAPWFVIPADNKWFTRLTVSSVVVHALQEMGLEYPKVSDEKRRALATARRELERKGKPKHS
jgi:PPK2 family polyphosphate:nucleotide phosphotransferase